MFGWVLVVVGGLLILFALYWQLWFSRMPRREILDDPSAILCPANGTIATVEKYTQGSILAHKWNGLDATLKGVARSGWFVLIVMTPLNVHYQRAPQSGDVVKVEYFPGKFLNAVNNPMDATFQNERNEITIASTHGAYKVVQIAGFLARRIKCFVSRGAHVQNGETIGFIDFGSQVGLILPDNCHLDIKDGDVVVDGQKIGVWT